MNIFSVNARVINDKEKQKGFTLVELSIVLVIIGLIVSSVLVGQDLIRSAELRSTIGQYESFNAAIATFRGKYGGTPGDFAGQTELGFVGDGNGDGVLESDTANEHDGEYVYFWNHLGSTGSALISGSYDGTASGVTTTDINSFTPTATIGQNWGVYAVNGINHFVLGATLSNSGNNYTTTEVLSSIDARNIDEKVDDSRPYRGIVQARGASNTDPNTDPSYDQNSDASSCTGGTAAALSTAATYNTAFSDINCVLILRAQL